MAHPPDRTHEPASGLSAAEPAGVEMGHWMQEFGPGLRRYFLKRAPNADADDLVQEVFVRLQMRSGEGAVENVQGYLFTVANRVLINRYRYEAARGGGRQATLTDALQPVEEINPERVLIGRQEYERMIVALGRLPPRAKQAFIFHRFEEMSHAAIARRMGISLVAVRKLISRAALRIADVMEGRAP